MKNLGVALLLLVACGLLLVLWLVPREIGNGGSVGSGEGESPRSEADSSRIDTRSEPQRSIALADPGAAPEPDAAVLRFGVRDIASLLPVVGVRLMLSSGASQWAGVTDDEGAWSVAIPADGERLLLAAKCDHGFILDAPRVLDRQTGSHHLLRADQVVVHGVVRDPNGTGVSGASVFLVRPRGIERGKPWPEAQLLAESDAAGLFQVVLSESWPLGSSLVAAKSPWVPACRPLVVFDRTSSLLTFDLKRGGRWELIVTDESGVLLEGCRVLAVTCTSPVLDGWAADEVPAGAGSELGLVARSSETNRGGLAVIDGWPVGRRAHVRILPPRGQKHKVVGTDQGECTASNVISVTPVENGAVHVRVAPIPANEIIARGSLLGFSEAELMTLRLLRVGDDGGNECVQPRISDDGRFEARFSVGDRENLETVQLQLVAELRDIGWRVDVGKFLLGRGREVDGLIVRR